MLQPVSCGRRSSSLIARILAWAVLLACSPIHSALAQPKTAKEALLLAESAFEFRDFQKVVDALDPWLHPPRINDNKLMIEARRLMGISLHVLGREGEAKEEFGLLLRLDPKHKLDPFVVPPAIIATFESVRAQMIKVEPPPADPPKTRVEMVILPHRLVAFVPFGVPQFALDQPVWGVLWGGLQAVGVAANVAGFFVARRFGSAEPDFTRMVAVQYGGLALAALAYLGSVIHGNVRLSNQLEELTEPAPERPVIEGLGAAPLSRGASGTPVGLSLKLSF